MSTHQGYYKKLNGLAMGPPPAPYLANIWLSSFDGITREELNLYQRYIDDILTTIKKGHID
jgi:transposase-like protein